MKKLSFALCLVLIFSMMLSACGKEEELSIEERAKALAIGAPYSYAVQVLGEEGTEHPSGNQVYTWDCGNGKVLYVWLQIPSEDHDHSEGDDHHHVYDYPNDFIIKDFEIVEVPTGEQ